MASSAPYVPFLIGTLRDEINAKTLQDMFTNTREAWHPPGARGIFGGVAIAQCIAAGQRTVDADFAIHSCHCYFLLAGSNSIPITYHVERVRDGRSFATRTVQARQRGKCIFTTTMSFMKEAPGMKNLSHAVGMGGGAPPDEEGGGTDAIEIKGAEVTGGSTPGERKCSHWVRAKGKISPGAQVAALAYMTDWFFLGTIPRVHELFPPAVSSPGDRAKHKVESNPNGIGDAPSGGEEERPEIGMMVSLDHSIYFHEPGLIKADEWMFTEMQSPWAGNGRGVVTSRVFNRDGVLLATCMQEGVMRLKQDKNKAKL